MSTKSQPFISYCSPDQDRMADTNTGIYEFASVVRGLHIYKTVWTQLILMKRCMYIMWEDTNKNNKINMF